MNEAIEAIAKLLDKTPTQLGEDVFSLAALIEAQGNKGYELSDLAKFAEREDLAVQVQTYFLRDKLHADCYASILFYATGGGSRGRRRRYEAEGWMVRKNPHWKIGWLELYGDTDSTHVADIQRAEQERIAAEEAALAAAEPGKLEFTFDADEGRLTYYGAPNAKSAAIAVIRLIEAYRFNLLPAEWVSAGSIDGILDSRQAADYLGIGIDMLDTYVHRQERLRATL